MRQDVVVCVYLLHETPKATLPAIAKEMGRVLRPGGILVITDSIQVGLRSRSTLEKKRSPNL
jgi:ubiquinone/menaquinone biosynthesis C-methylase UbiE